MFKISFLENKPSSKILFCMVIYANNMVEALNKANDGRDISIVRVENLNLSKSYESRK